LTFDYYYLVSYSERSNWWDAGFVYGNNKAQVDKARTFKGGKVILSDIPHQLKENADGTYVTGDNKNSWVGVALLQDIFLKEHNWVADQIAKENPSFDDQELFDKSRVVVSNLVAKIHTIDWTVELLKTRLLRIGMETNWYGLLKAWFNIPIMFLSKIKKPKANNQGTPFCLTEEFAAVYRLHSLSPPGMILGGAEGKEFVNLIDLVGDKGRAEMRKTAERPKEFMKSALSFPCGSLTPHNYPVAYRNIAPTDDEGRDLPKTEKIDLAALDLFRDRERGILKFNEFRRQLSLKPYNTWLELCGNKADARKLELM
jgi:alpha-dioxygenase